MLVPYVPIERYPGRSESSRTHLIFRVPNHLKVLDFAKLHVRWYNIFTIRRLHIRLTVKKRAKLRHQYNQVPYMTWDNLWNGVTKTQEPITHKRANRFPVGEQTGQHAQQRQTRTINNKKDPLKKHRLDTVILEDSNMFSGTKVNLNSYADQNPYGKVTPTQEHTTNTKPREPRG